MSKKSISQKRVEREKDENQVLHRVFGVFLIGLALEIYLLIVYRGYVNTSFDSLLAWNAVLKAAVWVGLAMFIAGGAVAYFKRQDKKLFKPMLWVSGIGLFLFISSLVMTLIYPGGVTAMCVVVPIVMVLGIVYLLFQHECFLCTTVLAGGLFTGWLCSASANSPSRVIVIVGTVAAAIALAAVAALTRKAQAAGGKLARIRVFSLECDYRVVYAVLAVTFVCILVAMAFPGTVYYLMWVMGILLFAELAYYTSKLM